MNSIYQFRHSSKDVKEQNCILSRQDVYELNSYFSKELGINYERIFFGLKITDALADGFQITRNGYFDATESPTAIQTGKTLVRLYKELKSNKCFKIIDLFAGTGQMTWAFSLLGFEVVAFEKDLLRFKIAKSNLSKINTGLEKSITLQDGIEWIERNRNRNDIFAIYLDPPWNRAYTYCKDSPFSFLDLRNGIFSLIKNSIEIADVVAIKLPISFLREEIKLIAHGFSCDAFIEIQQIDGFDDCLNQATVYMFRKESSDPKIHESTVKLERPL